LFLGVLGALGEISIGWLCRSPGAGIQLQEFDRAPGGVSVSLAKYAKLAKFWGPLNYSRFPSAFFARLAR
jgi:hypothetical protein